MCTTEFQVTSTWRTTQTVEVPEDQYDELYAAVQRGELPEIVADQIDASTASLVDWDAS
jgi:hypothetical protein